MIRNGAALRVRALAEQTTLRTRWQQYPRIVQEKLDQLLHEYGLEVARMATEALEAYATTLCDEAGREGE